MEPMPATHIPGPCPRCGALTVDAAQGLCQPNFDIWGASTCPVQDTPDEDGLIHVINPAWVEWADTQIGER